MDMNIITYLACICFLFLFGKVFIVPIKKVMKFIFNSVLGGVVIWIINLVSLGINLHIGLNFFTSILIGVLGLPGAICLIIVKLLVRIKFIFKSIDFRQNICYNLANKK